jgi:hypothetical protein
MMSGMTKGMLLAAGLGLASVLSALAWFDPYDPYYGKVAITRANTYVTVPSNINLSTMASFVGVNFFDFGDVDPEITADYGGDPADTFHVAWPVSFCVYFFTNSASVAEGGGYSMARLQYMEGTNSGSSTSWTDMPISPITNFNGLLGVEGGHFGLVTWTPPKVTNTYYLIRVWARLKNGMESASLTSLNIDKDGTANQNDWNDYEVLLVKTLQYKKPGAKIDEPAVHEYDAPVPQAGIWKRVWGFVKNVVVFWK